MKMCDVLKPIAVDVVVCMSQLFDLYFYAVFDFFSSKEVCLANVTRGRLCVFHCRSNQQLARSLRTFETLRGFQRVWVLWYFAFDMILPHVIWVKSEKQG